MVRRQVLKKNLSVSNCRRALQFTTHYSEVLRDYWFPEEEGKFIHVALTTTCQSQG